MRRLLLTCLLLSLAACGVEEPAGSPSPSPSQSQSQPVDFPAADGTTLTGRLYGSGSTAVVLSNMGDNDPAPWDGFAPVLAARGYTVLTYGYRYPMRTSSFTAANASGTVADLRGAIAFVRARVRVGSS